eukprot:2778459-Ditylum_brightwellii.AAC.1
MGPSDYSKPGFVPEGISRRSLSQCLTQADMKGDPVYISIPPKTRGISKNHMLKLNMNLCGQADAPKMWYDALKAGLDERGFDKVLNCFKDDGDEYKWEMKRGGSVLVATGMKDCNPDKVPTCASGLLGPDPQGCSILWVSKLQTEIALSTLHAEYVVLYQSLQDLLPTKDLFLEIMIGMGTDIMKLEFISKSTVYEDNTSTIRVVSCPRLTPTSNFRALKISL